MALVLDGEYGFTHGRSLTVLAPAHGRSLTVLAPAVMNFNLSANPAKYAQIANALGEGTEKLIEEEVGRRAITAVIKLVNDLGVPIRLRDYGIEKDKLEQMGKRAFEIGQRLLPMNPRPMGEDDSVRIYQEAY
jgi:1,3-propanediol dehydrogenase